LITSGAMQVGASDLDGERPDGGAAEAAAWRNELSGAVGGAVVQAQAIYGNVQIAASPPRYRHYMLGQLPAAPTNFTGRSAELGAMEDLSAGAAPPCRLAIVVIVGSGGLGKSSLASHWLKGASARYPDGVLFAELGGQNPADIARPGDVLAGFLRVLGVAPDSIPTTLSQQAALFRSLTAGKRMAVFLDDAASAAQVRTLLPGPSPALEPGLAAGDQQPWPSLVIVTTRWRITGLAVEGARFLELGPFGELAALKLLGRIAGEGRVAAEADASREVVRLCGGMPLAVCVSGARLAAHRQWPVNKIARELASERSRLSALSLPGDLSVRAAFDVSYRALTADAARAYRMTAAIPGPYFCADLAAAVLDDEERTQEQLDALIDASLLTEDADGCYRLHDLIRLHAREQARVHSSGEWDAAIARSVAWHLRKAVTADKVVLPGRWRLGPLYEQASEAESADSTPAEALDWLEAHLLGLLEAVRAAHDAGLHAQAWQLCEALWGVLLFRKHYTAWIASHETGLRSAQACADECATAQMHIQLGAAHRSMGRLEEAAGHFGEALKLFRAAGHRLGEASALDHLGVVQLRSARYSDAIAHFKQARDIHLSIGRPRGIALMSNNIGQALAASGQHDEAIAQFRMAETQFAAIAEPYHRARTLTALGGALIETGQLRESAEPLGEALAITEQLGASYDRAHVHVRLADLGELLGQSGHVQEHLEQALALFTELDAPQAESVRARLARFAGRPAHRLTDLDPGGGS
jgi:tetratricopeptide (TPR) repeat protein